MFSEKFKNKFMMLGSSSGGAGGGGSAPTGNTAAEIAKQKGEQEAEKLKKEGKIDNNGYVTPNGYNPGYTPTKADLEGDVNYWLNKRVSSTTFTKQQLQQELNNAKADWSKKAWTSQSQKDALEKKIAALEKALEPVDNDPETSNAMEGDPRYEGKTNTTEGTSTPTGNGGPNGSGQSGSPNGSAKAGGSGSGSTGTSKTKDEYVPTQYDVNDFKRSIDEDNLRNAWKQQQDWANKKGKSAGEPPEMQFSDGTWWTIDPTTNEIVQVKPKEKKNTGTTTKTVVTQTNKNTGGNGVTPTNLPTTTTTEPKTEVAQQPTNTGTTQDTTTVPPATETKTEPEKRYVYVAPEHNYDTGADLGSRFTTERTAVNTEPATSRNMYLIGSGDYYNKNTDGTMNGVNTDKRYDVDYSTTSGIMQPFWNYINGQQGV